MPLKPLPSSYTDTGENIPEVESQLLSRELERLIEKEGWKFLSEEQLDENYEEWGKAAEPLLPREGEIREAELAISGMSLLHVARADNLQNIINTGKLTSHHYRVDHKDEYPDYSPRVGYPADYEKVLGLDDYVCFSNEQYSHFKRLGSASFLMPAQPLLELSGTLVTPFDAPLYLSGATFHDRPPIIQASILRGQDYLKLLPAYVAAFKSGLDAGRIYPAWFQHRFGSRKHTSAEVKVKQSVSLSEVDWSIRYNSRDPTNITESLELLRGLGSKAIDEA